MQQRVVFVGRVTEQDTFRSVLARVRSARVSHKASSESSTALIVLGHGGMGKSTLLQRLHSISSGELANDHRNRRRWVRAFVDWEVERDRDPSRFPLPDGPNLSVLLGTIYNALLEQNKDWRRRRLIEKRFRGFRQQALTMAENEERVRKLGLARPVTGRAKTSEKDIKTAVEAAGALGGAFAETGGLTGVGPLIKAASGGAGLVAAAASPAARAKRRGELDSSVFATLVDERRSFIETFSKSLAAVSGRLPVVLFLDTAELHGTQGHLIREVISKSGSRVLWVLGIRLESGSDPSATNEIAMYRRVLPEGSFQTIQLEQFSTDALSDYMEQRMGRKPTSSAVEDVFTATRGIPLAVMLAVDLIHDGLDTGSLLESELNDGDTVAGLTNALTERYLIHIRSHAGLSADLKPIFGLALRYDSRPDPAILGILLGTSPEDVSSALAGLAARHDFVLTRAKAMHPEVQETIRKFLLDPIEGQAVAATGGAVAGLLLGRLGRPRVSMRDLFADSAWRNDLEAYLWYLFWRDVHEGFSAFLTVWPVAELLATSTSDALTRVVLFFWPRFSPEQRQIVSSLRSMLRRFNAGIDGFPGLADERAKAGRNARLEALSEVTRTFTPGLVESADRSLALEVIQVRLGRATGSPSRERLSAIEGILGRTNDPGIVSEVAALALQLSSAELEPGLSGWIESSEIGISAARVVVRLEPDNYSGWNELGIHAGIKGQIDRSEDAFSRALELQPMNAAANFNMGVVKLHRGLYAQAKTHVEIAIGEVENAHYYSELGLILIAMGSRAEALKAVEKAIELDSEASHITWVLRGALMQAHDIGVARESFRRALEIHVSDTLRFTDLEYRALAMFALGQQEDAVETLRNAFRYRTGIEPIYMSVYELLAEASNFDISRLLREWEGHLD